MLSALPLEECADKAAADQRLQAMGAFVCVRVCVVDLRPVAKKIGQAKH